MKTTLTLAAAGCALAVSCGAAQAQNTSFMDSLTTGAPTTPWTVRAGVSHVAPRSSATDAVGPFLPGPPSGVSLEVQDKYTAFFSLAYALSPNTELELALGYPPTHPVTAKLAPFLPANVQPLNGQTVAMVRQVAPTLFFNYAFGEANATWRPFVGVGINYTKFDKRTTTRAGTLLNGGPTDLSLSDSWGLAAQAGIDYRVNERWSIHTSVATARVKTHLVATTAGQPREIDIRFHPVVLTVSAAYRF